jgi:hypothetical protein
LNATQYAPWGMKHLPSSFSGKSQVQLLTVLDGYGNRE